MQTQLSIIFNRLPLIALCIVFLSCDPDDRMNTPQYNYNVAIKNTSQEALTIKGYKTKDDIGNFLPIPQLLNILVLAPNTVSETETIHVPVPLGNIAFGFSYPSFNNGSDSIVLMFADNRGYYSNNNDTVFWIVNKSTLLSVLEKDITNEDNVLKYAITQEDYENAHVLP